MIPDDSEWGWASLPEFFLRFSSEVDGKFGYAFGLRVRESWWDQACKNQLVQKSVRQNRTDIGLI
jgi:hypothetical protein